MTQFIIQLTGMANGGAALGRDINDRIVFVPFGIPGERVKIEITAEKRRFAEARITDILDPSPDRVLPQCPHFGVCGGCQFQHISYDAQLKIKSEVVRDQLERIGGFHNILVRPIFNHPTPWKYTYQISMSPTKGGNPGYWSPYLNQVIGIKTCPIADDRLQNLLEDIDLTLPGYWELILRVGDDGQLLAALDITEIEPPDLETDFPISVALILPDGTAANLVGNNYLFQSVLDREFRISAGCYMHNNPIMASKLITSILTFVKREQNDSLLELYSGVGTLTAYLSPVADQITAVEKNPDAINDAAFNLRDLDNVRLFEGSVEDILPLLDIESDIIVADPPSTGLSTEAVDYIIAKWPRCLIYASSNIATFARDAKRLRKGGYELKEVQPIDMYPQTFHVQTVSYFTR